MLEFLQHPDANIIIASAFFILLTLGVFFWFFWSNWGWKGTPGGAKERRRNRMFEVEITNVTPGGKLLFSLFFFVLFSFGAYWLLGHVTQEFADLESGKVKSIKVDSLTAWAYHALGTNGAVGLTWVLVLFIWLRSGDEVWDAWKEFRAARRSKDKDASRDR